MPAASRAPSARGRLRDRFFVTGAVTQIDPIARRMLRIRIEGDRIPGLAWIPGQHVRVHVADVLEPRSWLRPMDLLRTYSVWRHDDGIELCVLDHDNGGPGVAWARQLRTGDLVSFSGPQGSFVLHDGAYHVFAGDETAAVAFGPMLRALAPGAAVYGVIEAGEPGGRLPLDRPLRWQYRDGQSAASSQSLLEALSDLQLPGEPGVAYLAGEAKTIQLLRTHLVTERGWPRRAVITKPFWTPGKRGLD